MKIYRVEIAVPSGSRVVPFFKWLQKLLGDHRMEVRRVEEPETGEYINFTPESELDKD